MVYIYELTAYECSDFTYWLVSHEKKYTKEEFKAIVKEANNKIKKNWNDWGYMNDLLSILGQQYGFRHVKPTVSCHIGGYRGFEVK